MDIEDYLGKAGQRVKQDLAEKLEKLKVALGEESEHTKEMLETYQRFMLGQATKKEMDVANEQFKSFLKTIGLGVLVVLPFSPITIPAIVNLAKKYNIDILPNSMKDMGKKNSS